MAFVEMDHHRRTSSPGSGPGSGLEAEVEALAAENRSIREYLGRVVDLLGATLETPTPAARRPEPAATLDLDDDLLPAWARADEAQLSVDPDEAVIDTRRRTPRSRPAPVGGADVTGDDAARIEELERRVRRLEARLDALLDVG